MIQSRATIILVDNVNDAGIGSMRDAIASASLSANDTILINVKGTINLNSALVFDSFTALTVIGPYAKHNKFTATGIWTGSLFHISNSEGIIFQNLGFDSGNGNTRHVTIENSPNDILFERCIFENSNYTVPLGEGGAVIINNSTAAFSKCSFINNSADKGGAMATTSSSALTLINCTFSENTATGNTGALSLTGTTAATLLFNTFVNNESPTGNTEAIRATGGTTVSLGNNAIGNNGTGRQVRLNGAVGSLGRNVIKQNYPSEPLNLVAIAGDIESTTIDLGLRATILEDGYGLKYWPITSTTSDLINPASPGASVPDLDCRNAPRNLKGSSLVNAYPDAGACEYTHLRVTNDSGLPGSANSFLWAIAIAQQRDDIHYIEFDIPSPSDILFTSEGKVDEGVYIIDGFSQPLSAIPGPHEIGIPGVTRAVLLIDFVNGGSHHHGVQFEDNAEGSILQGVSVQGFNRHGVEPNRSEDISIFGCEIGIDNAGAENGNARAGLRINSSGNKIGGWEHWMRNVISGNGLSGTEETNVTISFSNNSNIIMGNIIGGSGDGMNGIGPGSGALIGIFIGSSYNQIGGTLPNSGNIIIDNQYGTYHDRYGDFNQYSGNLIGLAWDQSTAVENPIAGISINGGDNNTIGGLSIKNQNQIAHNGTGIELAFSSTIAESNAILGNLIHNNINQGIDINADDVVLTNDGIFDDANSNYGIDFPEILSSTSCGTGSSKTTFVLNVPISQDYRVEFFRNTSPDPTNGEGEFLLNSETFSVTTKPQTFIFDHGYEIGASISITATVTQLSSNNTSEFAANFITTPPVGDPTISYDDVCPWETATPIYGGDTGGDFRFSDPVPVDGAVIDAVSGEVTGTIEGTTYEVIYGFSGDCIIEDTTTFSVMPIDETFSFADFCPGTDGIATSVATPTGTFSLNPDFGDGASIIPDSGILTGGVEGTTYTIQYIADDGVCKDTGYVNALVTPTDESFTMNDFCPEVVSADAVPVTAGGDFYFAPDLGDGASINILTGAITGGIEGTTYMVRYVVGACAEEDTVSVSVIAADESFVFDNFCPGEIGSPSAVIEPGGFSFLTPPGDGAMINPGTGDITFGVEGTIYEVLHTAGLCSDKDTAYPTVITVNEEFTFADFCEVNDSSAIVPVAVDPGNSTYILLGPDDGATVNATTGRIYNPIEGTTYTVVDSVWALGCWQADTVEVLTILVNEYFEYNNICVGASGFPDDDVELGGDFSIVDDPGDGVTINPLTGELSGGLAGTTYTIRYIKDVDLCADTLEQEVMFIEVDASFEFPDFCPGLDPSPAPIPLHLGGTYDFATPPVDGETINTSTGQIIGPIEGNSYEISYTIIDADIGCTDTQIESVNVKVVNEDIAYEDFCWEAISGAAELLELGGTLSFGTPAPVDGATLDAEGVISGATEGAEYTIVHVLEIDGCIQTDSALVTALGVDESFIFDDYCASIESPAPVATTGGGEYTFVGDVDPEITINSSTGVITGGVEGEYYIVMYSVFDATVTCNESAIDTVYVLGNDESFSMDNFCAEFSSDEATAAVDGGTYTFEPDPADGAEIDPATGIITSAEPGTTYGVMYTLTLDGCTDRDTNLVVAYASEVADFTIENYCANITTPIEITGTIGGLFNFHPSPPADGSTINTGTGEIAGSVGGTYEIIYITPGTATTCSDTLIQSLTLFDIPKIITLSSDEDLYCPDDVLGPITVTDDYATTQVYWYVGETGGDISDSSFTYTPENLNVGNNTFYAKPKSAEGCYGEYASYELYLSDTSGMRAIDDFKICLGSSAPLKAFGGSYYKWHTDVPLADYNSAEPIAFSLQEEAYVVSIFNDDNCEVMDTIKVTFSSQNECAIDVYNAFSPNDDGKNDFWYIDNLINYMPNTVYIYNRWGDVVQKIANYDNITTYWDGTGSNGNALPPNTYFYVVITDVADQSQAGWVQLVR